MYPSVMSKRARFDGKWLFHVWLMAVLLLLVTGCSVIEIIPTVSQSEQVWQQRVERLQRQTDWNIQASVAGVSGEETFKARFLWQQRNAAFEIRLFDPIGRTVARISGNEGRVEVRTSKGEYYEDSDAQSLIRELFGIELPVDGLRYWALGIPASEQAEVVFDQRGLATTIIDTGWQIDYSDYAVFDQQAMPKKFDLQYASTILNVSVGTWELL